MTISVFIIKIAHTAKQKRPISEPVGKRPFADEPMREQPPTISGGGRDTMDAAHGLVVQVAGQTKVGRCKRLTFVALWAI